MRLTDEMVERDDARYAGRNGLAEIKYLGREVEHRKAITNDDIRFMAWAFRFADAEIERLKALINHKPDCANAEHDSGGCLGYSGSHDDEPIEACKNCEKYTGYTEEDGDGDAD